MITLTEGNGTLHAWFTRRREPLDFLDGIRVRTSPKRPDDSIEYGTVVGDPYAEGAEWRVRVLWDWDPSGFHRDHTGGLHSYDLRSLLPVPEATCS